MDKYEQHLPWKYVQKSAHLLVTGTALHLAPAMGLVLTHRLAIRTHVISDSIARRDLSTALHCNALHCTALHCRSPAPRQQKLLLPQRNLVHVPSDRNSLHCTALHCTALREGQYCWILLRIRMAIRTLVIIVRIARRTPADFRQYCQGRPVPHTIHRGSHCVVSSLGHLL